MDSPDKKSSDFNGDDKVNFGDFLLFAAAFENPEAIENTRFDLNGNGKVDFPDFILFAQSFGQ